MCKTSSCSLIGSCLSTEAMFSMLSVRRIVVECPRGRNLRSLCIPFQHVLELCTTIIGWKQPADCEYLDTKLNNRWIKIGPRYNLFELVKNDANVSVHLGVGGCLISVKLLKYIPRIKGTRYTEADMVCAIAFALFILWKNLVSKRRKFLNQLNMNGGGKEGEGIRLPE